MRGPHYCWGGGLDPATSQRSGAQSPPRAQSVGQQGPAGDRLGKAAVWGQRPKAGLARGSPGGRAKPERWRGARGGIGRRRRRGASSGMPAPGGGCRRIPGRGGSGGRGQYLPWRAPPGSAARTAAAGARAPGASAAPWRRAGTCNRGPLGGARSLGLGGPGGGEGRGQRQGRSPASPGSPS